MKNDRTRQAKVMPQEKDGRWPRSVARDDGQPDLPSGAHIGLPAGRPARLLSVTAVAHGGGARIAA